MSRQHSYYGNGVWAEQGVYEPPASDYPMFYADFSSPEPSQSSQTYSEPSQPSQPSQTYSEPSQSSPVAAAVAAASSSSENPNVLKIADIYRDLVGGLSGKRSGDNNDELAYAVTGGASGNNSQAGMLVVGLLVVGVVGYVIYKRKYA